MSVAVGEEWLCDQCTAINSSSVFPCHQCGYPIHVDPTQPSSVDLEYEGVRSGTFVALDSPTAHPGTPGLRTALDDAMQHEGPGFKLPISPLKLEGLDQFLCPVCYLDSKEPPCVLCGFDPTSDEAPEQDEPSIEYACDVTCHCSVSKPALRLRKPLLCATALSRQA